MSEISDLERRLTEALDRMRKAHQAKQAALQAANENVASLEAELATRPAVDDTTLEDLRGEVADLQAALGEEKTKAETLTSDLGEQRAEVSALMEALATEKDNVTSLTEEGSAGLENMAKLETELRGLRAGERLGNLQAGAGADALQGRITELERSLEQLQLANGQLRRNNAALRKAHEIGLPDADLVNDGLKAEIEALSAARDADRAEIDSVLAALKQLTEEAANA